MKQLLLTLPLSLFFLITIHSTSLLKQDTATPNQFETTYDDNKDRTTVRLKPVQISDAKAQYHSVHIASSFNYPGHRFKKPEIVDFEVQTVVKTKLKIDLYVVFLVDGHTIFLSSNRGAVKRPVTGKRWRGERLVFRMPYETLIKITKARTVEIKMDGVVFPLAEAVLEKLRMFARLTDSQ
jgi:hypothetical protein